MFRRYTRVNIRHVDKRELKNIISVFSFYLKSNLGISTDDKGRRQTFGRIKEKNVQKLGRRLKIYAVHVPNYRRKSYAGQKLGEYVGRTVGTIRATQPFFFFKIFGRLNFESGEKR